MANDDADRKTSAAKDQPFRRAAGSLPLALALPRAALRPGPNRIARRLRTALGQWPRVVNIGLLMVGFGLGQGSIFAIQTWLVAKGRFALLSLFATHYSLAMFGIIVIDGGSSAIIARRIAQLSNGRAAPEEFWRVVSETMALRLVLAVLLCIGAALYALWWANDGFSRGYVLFGLPGLLLWAGNAVGLLDGLKLSGISGITGSLAYATSAIGLVMAPDARPDIAGAILGGAFSVGYLLTVAAQWAVLRRYGWAPQFKRVTVAGFGRSFKDGSALLFQLVPGQAISRVQLVLSTVYLGAETTALFAYVKQIVVMATMVVGLVLRVEFPGLVQILSRSKAPRLGVVFKAQKLALCAALALTIGVAFISSIGLMIPQHRFGAASMTLLTFCPTILAISLCLIMVQGLMALGAYGPSARAMAMGAAIGIVVSCLFVAILDLYAFLFGEAVFNLASLFLMYKSLGRYEAKVSDSCQGGQEYVDKE